MPIDLTDPCLLLSEAVIDDPGELYAVLRATAPVWQVPGCEAFLVTDPELVRDVVGRPSEFSSNLVRLLHRGPEGRPVVFEMAAPGSTTHVLAIADPPDHTVQRRVLQPLLSAAALKGFEPRLRELADGLLAELLPMGGDIVEALCDPLPAAAICLLAGLPNDDVPFLLDVVGRTAVLVDGTADRAAMESAAVAALDLVAYGDEQLAAARARGLDQSTLLGALRHATDAGTLSAETAVNILLQLVTAGTETTTSLIARATQVLADDLAIQTRLRAEPDRIPGFIEEVLRRAGPFQFHYRWTPTDADTGGVTIPADSIVLLMWAAADRDTAPEQPPIDLERAGAVPHLAFGRGLHFCIGAHLARLEARVAIEQLLRSTASFRLDPDAPPVERPSLSIKRLSTLTVRIERA
jgi:cytochrome P450